jgi:3'-phosphoadenosine 5'-phosphosulfate sulfotransferase (PAPS reductase)/FAD synthetase
MNIIHKYYNNPKGPVICWWSGGITSAVACKISIDLYGLERCRFIMLDTRNEHPDTYRFKADCEKWYGKEIESMSNGKYKAIEDIWYDYVSLNVAHGAICSSESKRAVRLKFQRENPFLFQVFGFDIEEPNRAKNIKKNYPTARPIFPLLLYGLTKKDCIKIVQNEGIEIPEMYKLGFPNNNCFGTGCVQGGIGYWQKIQREFPDKFDKMAEHEHNLTDLKGKPVTCCKDQCKEAKENGLMQVFLKPHPDYPQHKDLSQMKGREPKSMVECNGFCGIQGNLFNQLNP